MKINISKYIKDNQIISVVGATATGKTAFALDLADIALKSGAYQRIHLLSADSRQVYQGLENLTAADVPADFAVVCDKKFAVPFFANQNKTIFLHGVSIIQPHEEWSVAHFKKLFEKLKKNLGAKELLIVVGGTGFYQQQIVETAESLFVPRNVQLRQDLEKLSVEELKNRLRILDTSKYQSLNHSDLNNPRRLVRAIEIAVFQKQAHSTFIKKTHQQTIPTFYLQIPKAVREQKIKARIEQRFTLAKKEVEQQLQKHITDQSLAFTSTGFMELKQLIKGEIDQATCLKLWQTAEIQYAKRQDTWWKKRTGIIKINL